MRQGGALQTAAAELGRRVWEPLRPHLGDARTVLIAPDGGLSFFPFAALPGSRPGSYLIEDLAIGYVASGRRPSRRWPTRRDRPGAGCWPSATSTSRPTRASPDRPHGPRRASRRGRTAGRVRPAAGDRPRGPSARDLFHAAFADQPAELLTRAEPTEAEIKQRLDGGHWRVVHLATHGFFESPARIAALRAEVRREDPFALPLMAAKPEEDDLAFDLTPLLRSGVVLAGGGRDPAPGCPMRPPTRRRARTAS